MKDEPHGNDIEHLRAKPADIVERLRSQPHILGSLYAEAADEIERLRLRKRPVAWRVKNFADGWTIYQDEATANHEAEKLGGALVQGLYIRGEQ